MTNLPAGIRTSFIPIELVIGLAARWPRAGPCAIRDNANTQAVRAVGKKGAGPLVLGGQSPFFPTAGMRSAFMETPLYQLPRPEADNNDRRTPGKGGAGPRAAPLHV